MNSPWLLTELAGKVFKQAVCASNDGMLQVTIEFEDLSQISILMKSKQVVSFETARLEDGDLTDIRPARPAPAAQQNGERSVT